MQNPAPTVFKYPASGNRRHFGFITETSSIENRFTSDTAFRAGWRAFAQ
jgi:hypothetical protein